MLRRVTLLVVVASGSASADTGVDVGVRGGIAHVDATDPFVGAAVRISVPSSPIAVEPTFDDVVDSEQTLHQLGASLLHDVPVGGRVIPYGGVGLTMTAFKLANNTMGVDNEGYRVGMKLLAGARLDLLWVSPYVAIEQGIGEYHLTAVAVGLAFHVRERHGIAAPPALPRLALTPYIANNVAGDVQSGRAGVGVSLAYYAAEHLGFELDAEAHGHFFVDEDVAELVPMGVDLNTKAMLASASVIVPYCVRVQAFGTWCPYASAGAGAIHAAFDGRALMPGTQPFATTQTNLALSGGAGITHVFTRHVGFRVDARYFHAFVDENAHEGGYFKDYGFLCVSAGLTVGLPWLQRGGTSM